MASFQKRGDSWFAQIRRKGHKSISKSFPTKTLAQEWARKIERQIDTDDFQDGRSISATTIADLIDKYSLEKETERPFGKNKKAVLASLRKDIGSVKAMGLTDAVLMEHVGRRRKGGAGGVTLAIELTYLGSVFKTASQVWKMPVKRDAIDTVRANLSHLGVSLKSKERKRRPTLEELEAISTYFDTHSSLPMRDIIAFAVATAMRLGEIINLKQADLNESDRTIIIRDRKHPQLKAGNDQEVPLLGEAFAIAKRQPKNDRLFPVTDGTVSTIFPRACRELGIIDLRFHDLRHEGVSRLFEQGYSIEQVALVSGHRDWKMLSRYVQLKAKDLHRKL
jgi:integrase